MRTVVIALMGLFALSPSASAAEPQFRAGAYAQDVTPTTFPISVNGNMADKLATAAHDPLHARCLVLDDGKTKIALVVVDSCMIPREIHDGAKALAEKKTSIPTANILISATHTHTAPTVTGVFQSEPDKPYIQFLTEKIAEGIDKANVRLAPAKAGWGSAMEPNQVFNRRWKMKRDVANFDPFGGRTDQVKMNPGYRANNPGLLEPAGPVDPEVSVLSIRTAKGLPLALYANYSLHYVGDMPALSADYFGVFGDRIGGILGKTAPGFVGILSNGASGDVNNVNFGGPVPGKRDIGERSRLVAETVGQAAKKAADTSYRSDITLAVAVKELEFKIRKPTGEELKRAEQLLERAKGRDLKGVEEIYARETVLIARYPDRVKLKLQAIRIGDLGIAAIPCEVFAEIGLEIKKKSPLARTFTVSLANGYNGYLPTPAQHALGGYETWRARSSYLEVNAADTITRTMLDLLAKVAK
jgi:neutral ceramidase